AGVPFNVVLEKALPIKHEGLPVEGSVVDPIYVFDHLAIPAGTQILGHVTHVESASRKQRGLAIANGNFSPIRKADVDFDTLVLKDGTRLRIQTVVSQGAPRMVHLSAGEQGKKKKGRVKGAVEQARQEAKAREQETVKEIKAPGKMQRVRAKLWAEFPYHNPTIAGGTHFTAELKTPLELGKEDRSPQQLQKIGGEIPPGSVVHVRLVTALSSATVHKGSAVEAVVSEPVFSPNHQLILPEGARLDGVVTQSRPARRLGRNGQLRFMFRQIEVSTATPRKVEATLQGVDAASGAHLQLDAEGGAHAITPKTKFIAPAIDVLLATSSLDGLDPHNHRRIEEGLGRQGPDVAGGAVRGGAGFGLVGTVVGLLVHYRPISAGFAFYGAGLSVYSHVVARGNEVVFPKDTEMEIRFGTHESPAAPAAKGQPFVSELSKPTNPF
ncbi:MAG: hypothetical protein ACRD2O_06750, partial [Terriglobia bacterium]